MTLYFQLKNRKIECGYLQKYNTILTKLQKSCENCREQKKRGITNNAQNKTKISRFTVGLGDFNCSIN